MEEIEIAKAGNLCPEWGSDLVLKISVIIISTIVCLKNSVLENSLSLVSIII